MNYPLSLVDKVNESGYIGKPFNMTLELNAWLHATVLTGVYIDIDEVEVKTQPVDISQPSFVQTYLDATASGVTTAMAIFTPYLEAEKLLVSEDTGEVSVYEKTTDGSYIKLATTTVGSAVITAISVLRGLVVVTTSTDTKVFRYIASTSALNLVSTFAYGGYKTKVISSILFLVSTSHIMSLRMSEGRLLLKGSIAMNSSAFDIDEKYFYVLDGVDLYYGSVQKNLSLLQEGSITVSNTVDVCVVGENFVLARTTDIIVYKRVASSAPVVVGTALTSNSITVLSNYNDSVFYAFSDSSKAIYQMVISSAVTPTIEKIHTFSATGNTKMLPVSINECLAFGSVTKTRLFVSEDKTAELVLVAESPEVKDVAGTLTINYNQGIFSGTRNFSIDIPITIKFYSNAEFGILDVDNAEFCNSRIYSQYEGKRL